MIVDHTLWVVITSGKAISMECQERALHPYRIDDRHVSRFIHGGTGPALTERRERPDRMVGALCGDDWRSAVVAAVGQRRLAAGTALGLALPPFSEVADLVVDAGG